MLKIGDRVLIDNYASRSTSSAANGYYARYNRRLLPEEQQRWGIFLGWATWYEGFAIESTNGRKGKLGNGELINRKAVKVAVVQPECGNQWRKPWHMFITDEGMIPQYAATYDSEGKLSGPAPKWEDDVLPF